MTKLVTRLNSTLLLLRADKSGASAAEYALLVSLIAVAIAATVGLFGTAIGGVFAAATTAIK